MKAENDFSERSALRQFEIIVEKRSVFVNAHYLAEISPYFEYLCFGNFREAREGRAELEEESYSEFIEFLNFICPDRDYQLQRDISETNFAILTHFARLMQIPSLRQHLESFVEGEFSGDNHEISDVCLIDMIVEAKLAAFSDSLMQIMYRKLAKFDIEHIKKLLDKLPNNYADAILNEVQRFATVYPAQQPYRSAYHYNKFDQRIFF